MTLRQVENETNTELPEIIKLPKKDSSGRVVLESGESPVNTGNYQEAISWRFEKKEAQEVKEGDQT